MPKKTSKAARKPTAAQSIVKNTLKSLICGVTSFVAVLCIFSFVIIKTNIPYDSLCYFVLAAGGLSALVCSLVSCRLARAKSLINAMMSVIILLIAEFITLLCFNNAQISYRLYLLIPTMLIFGFLGCILGVNIRKK